MRFTKELLINSLLAGFWTAAGILAASKQPIDTAAIFAALVVGLRFTIGILAMNAKKIPTVPVDE